MTADVPRELVQLREAVRRQPGDFIAWLILADAELGVARSLPAKPKCNARVQCIPVIRKRWRGLVGRADRSSGMPRQRCCCNKHRTWCRNTQASRCGLGMYWKMPGTPKLQRPRLRARISCCPTSRISPRNCSTGDAAYAIGVSWMHLLRRCVLRWSHSPF